MLELTHVTQSLKEVVWAVLINSSPHSDKGHNRVCSLGLSHTVYKIAYFSAGSHEKGHKERLAKDRQLVAALSIYWV